MPQISAIEWQRREHGNLALGGDAPLARGLLHVVDAGLAGVIFVVPWCMGGRHPLGELVLVALVLAASIAWLARRHIGAPSRPWTRSPADVIFPAAVVLVLLQLAPLPPRVLDMLSSHTRELLPVWTTQQADTIGLGAWNQVSMAPSATQSALVMLVAYGLLFFTALARLERLEDVERLLRWVAASVALVAGFGLLQYLTSNGKFLWIYKHPFRYTYAAATGMYINKNHFAHLLALGVGPLVWCLARAFAEPSCQLERLARGGRPWRKMAYALALALVMFAGLMSLSRGGVAMIALASVASGAAMYRARLLSPKLVASIVAVALLVGGALAIHGYRAVAERLDDYAAGSLTELDRDGGRRAIWRADFAAAKNYLVLGSGAGSHREVYPTYMPEPFETEFTHAENGYLQIALECGLPGLVLLIASLGCLAACCVKSLRRAGSRRLFACSAAVTASLLVSAAHSFVDFVWYVPSCLAITLVLAATALRLWQWNQTARPAEAPTTSARWALAAALGVALVGAWMVQDRARAALAAPHWDAYLEFALTPAVKAGRLQPGPAEIEHLERVARWTPGDARAHLALAEACLQQFERLQSGAANAMPRAQIRDAALASKFASRAALDAWLARAVGDHRRFLDAAFWHARRALANCPLEGQAYLYLAELCFLNSPDGLAKGALVDQALRVRPYSGSVLMCAGSEAALVGDLAKAFDCWRRAFAAGSSAQRQVVDLWAGTQMPVEIILDQFRPGLPATRMMLARYDELGRVEQARATLEYYAQLGANTARQAPPAEAAELWFELHDVYRRLENAREELHALQIAVALVPNEYRVHYALATALVRGRQFAEAEQHLRWCLERKGEDAQLRDQLAAVVKSRIDGQRVSISQEPARWR